MTLCVTNELRNLVGAGLKGVESPSLRLSKTIRLEPNGKAEEIDAVVNCHNRHAHKPSPLPFNKATDLYMKLRGRLIVNQAGGILENAGLCLHRNFGYPYIPGSAVKGCARHYAWELWQSEEDTEKKKELAKNIALTFGFPTGDKMPSDKKDVRDRKNPEEYLDNYLENEFPELFGFHVDKSGKKRGGKYRAYSGGVAFLDAQPYGKALLAVDILTCHHMKYYAGDEQYLRRSKGKALDNEDPNPQPFPVVEEGAIFLFQIFPVKTGSNIYFAEEMLRSALKVNGIGAKTSAGYGWFEPADEEVKSMLAAEQRAQEKARQAELRRQEDLLEEAKRREKKQKEAELAKMSPDEQVACWDSSRWNSCLRNIKEFDKLSAELQVSAVKALASSNREYWIALKEKAAGGKKKDKKAAIPVRDKIYQIAKSQTPKVKMP